MLKWDNLQHLKNSSKLFTPKNSSEADLISNKYDIKGPIWTDFVRVNPLSFYRKVLLILSKAHAEILVPRMDSIKQKKVHRERNISFNKNQNFRLVIMKHFGTMLA